MISAIKNRWGRLTASQKKFIMIHMLVETVRILYSFLFYNEVDLPCYAQFTKRFLSGDFIYSRYFCRWGYCYYPAFFLEFYSLLHVITLGLNSVLVRLVHLFAQLFVHLLMDLIFIHHLRENRWLTMGISCICQSMYFASISRLTNDTFSTLLVELCLLTLLEGQMTWAGIFYSLSVAYKMNTLFLGPGLLLLYFFHYRWNIFPVIGQFALMGLIQVLAPLPFLLADWKDYLSIAFNMSRDFEPRNNLAWGWLGDVLRLSPTFYNILLLLTVVFLFGFLFRQLYRCATIAPSANRTERESLIITTFIFPAFIGVVFSRGVHVQFLLWVLWSLPYLLVVTCRLSGLFSMLLIFIFDHCFVWNDGFLDFTTLPRAVMALTRLDLSGFFSELSHFSINRFPLYDDNILEYFHRTGKPAEKFLGRWYPLGTMNGTWIQHSILLFVVEVFILVRVFTVDKCPSFCGFKHAKGKQHEE